MPTDDDALLVEALADLAGGRVHVRGHLRGELAERVLRQVEPEELLLPAQALA